MIGDDHKPYLGGYEVVVALILQQSILLVIMTQCTYALRIWFNYYTIGESYLAVSEIT